jgi:co-chaperonin GroES (HSP10)
MVVKLDEKPTHSPDGLELPTIAVARSVCKHCYGEGGYGIPVYEEDGIWISKHIDAICEKCEGRGYFEATYDPRQRDLNTGVVLAVGPGEYKKKIEYSTFKPRYWFKTRERMEAQPGDRVLLAQWAGNSGWSFFLSEDHLIVNQYEVLANFGPAPTGHVPRVELPQSQSKVPGTPTESESSGLL